MDQIGTHKKEINRGGWTGEEDTKLAEVVAVHGAKKWKTIAAKAGLNRCGKSCRLRWMNYLRPNIKRGNMSDQEEDLILRLHKLLGNRWSLIARRLPGRTDNEIKNYWNSHLSKKIATQKEKSKRASTSCETSSVQKINDKNGADIQKEKGEEARTGFDVEDFFNISDKNPLILDWMTSFLDEL